MRLFDTEVPHGLPAVIDQVGAVVESPKFSPNFTGRQNLTLLARTRGISTDRIDHALATVSLTGRDRDRYKSYSLGMKQRLAIAATLLKDPALLILDEPTNGLDPAGIREIRDTIRSLGEAGVTVLLSSHILAEVQQVCDSVSIIGHGRLLADGRVDDLVGNDGRHGFRVGVADPAAAADHLLRAGLGVRRVNDHLLVDGVQDASDITRLLAQEELYVRELIPDRPDLESVFLSLTEGSNLGGAR